MENREAARALFGVAALLEAQGANPYRVRAYRRAAVRLMRLAEQVTTLTTDSGELGVEWLGDRLRRKVGELVTSGKMQFHHDILAELPRPLRELLAIPGIGPRTAERLMSELGVQGAEDVVTAAHQGRISALRGFGQVRETRLAAAAAETFHLESLASEEVDQLVLPGFPALAGDEPEPKGAASLPAVPALPAEPPAPVATISSGAGKARHAPTPVSIHGPVPVAITAAA